MEPLTTRGLPPRKHRAGAAPFSCRLTGFRGGETSTDRRRDGRLATTAEEPARLGDGLFAGRPVRPATLRRMTTLDRFGTGLSLFPKDLRPAEPAGPRRLVRGLRERALARRGP